MGGAETSGGSVGPRRDQVERVTVNVHSTDLVGTCDKTGECSSLEGMLGDLGLMGLEDDAAAMLITHRMAACEQAGRCTLWYGMQPEDGIQ